jgi:hypothetical protein
MKKRSEKMIKYLSNNNIKKFLLINILLMIFSSTVSAGFSSITSINQDQEFSETIDLSQKVYEISRTALQKKISITLKEKEILKLDSKEGTYMLVVSKIQEEKITLQFPQNRIVELSLETITFIDLNQDGDFDITFEVTKISDNTTISIQKYVNKIVDTSIDHIELFDITVRLARKTISSSKDLLAFITFENFGEGTSVVNIEYLIKNKKTNEEVYHGFDSIVVQTEEQIIKKFNFLNLQDGKYLLSAEISYRDKHTGSSQQDFEITDRVDTSLSWPLSFVGLILFCFVVIKFFIKRY